ncbi:MULTISPECIES: diacylglycerol kinase family protein [unclassified Trichocoleus]
MPNSTNTCASLPMSPDLSTQTSNKVSDKVIAKPNRDLSWRVAANLWISFKYAWAGLSYAFRTQRNFRIHVIVGSLAIGLGAFLRLSAVEMSIISLTIGAVLAMELLNTALESVVDLTVKQSYHELAKIAKDCAAGAVLISAIAAILVAGSLLLPPLLTLLQSTLR